MNNFFDLRDYLNKEENKIAYVCAMGPSLKKYLDVIDNQNAIIISCSDVDTMTNIIPNYWVFANSIYTAQVMNDRWKKFPNTTIVHADSVDVTHTSWIHTNVTNNYIGYDQRHFDNSTCNNCPNNCVNFVENRKTIQELLMEYTGFDKRYGGGCTVAVHCVSLAILLGCKEIYIFGCDLNYSLGYVDEKTTNNDSFEPWMNFIMEDFTIIQNSAKKIGVNIYNMSEVSRIKEIFETKSEI